jgi:ABC-2 type transport system permease protein
MIVPGLVLDARTWLLLTLVFVVGMVSTVPLGVALGAVIKSSQVPLVPLVSMLITILSGVFFPFALMPRWLQALVWAFPVYWVGLGTRAAMLPQAMMADELGKWRVFEMFAVPAMWAALGLLLAPMLLRRMARLQSGSALAKVRAAKGY